MIKTSVFLLFLCLSSAYAAELVPYRLNLQAERFQPFSFKATAVQQLQEQSPDQWQLSLRASKAIFSIDEVSRFYWQNDSMVPIYHTSETRIAFAKEENVLNFDQHDKSLIIKTKAINAKKPMLPGTLDSWGFQVQMRHDLMKGETELSYPIREFKRQTSYDFRILGEEMLKTPVGVVRTLKVEQVLPPKRNEQKFFWVAPSLDYVPVKTEAYEKGKLVTRITVTDGMFGDQSLQDLLP